MSGAVAAVGILRQPTLEVELSASSLSGAKYGSGSVVTLFATATPVGGTSPYTYLWEFVGADEGAVIQGSTGPSMRLQKTFATAPDSIEVTVKCTVTDSVLSVGVSDNLPATLACI